MIIYTGLFLNTTLFTTHEKLIRNQHVTHEFRPKEINKNLFGQTATLKIIGFGADDENEGYLVKITKASGEIYEAFKDIECLHITTGVSATGKPVNTANLNFEPCEPFTVEATYGGFTDKGKVVYHD